MSIKTPKRKSLPLTPGFSNVIVAVSPAAVSPQKNLTGLPRVARDLVADVYNNIQRWNDLHIKGAGIVKQIASLKADNPGSYADPLEELSLQLFTIVAGLRMYKDALGTFATQIRALEKLQTEPEPLFISHSVESLTNLVHEISEAYSAEFEVKVSVLENIAHSKEENEAMFLAALWTYQYKITKSITFKLETLLIETGHRKIQ